MSKVRKTASEPTRNLRPATTPEARELQLVSLAVDLAEKQLREGSATSQVITHYLKLGTSTAELEREILENQRDLLVAKTSAIKSSQRQEELFEQAVAAFKTYTPSSGDVI